MVYEWSGTVTGPVQVWWYQQEYGARPELGQGYCYQGSGVPAVWLIHTRQTNCCSWHHMMTSSNGNIFRVTGHLCGEITGHRWIPPTKASDAELWCFLCLRLNKWLSKQSWGWWYETPSHPLWRHGNDAVIDMQCYRDQVVLCTVYTIGIGAWAPSQYKDRLFRYGDPHVKDKTVGETVLSLTWESLYGLDDIFILRRPPGSV